MERVIDLPSLGKVTTTMLKEKGLEQLTIDQLLQMSERTICALLSTVTFIDIAGSLKNEGYNTNSMGRLDLPLKTRIFLREEEILIKTTNSGRLLTFPFEIPLLSQSTAILNPSQPLQNRLQKYAISTLWDLLYVTKNELKNRNGCAFSDKLIEEIETALGLHGLRLRTELHLEDLYKVDVLRKEQDKALRLILKEMNCEVISINRFPYGDRAVLMIKSMN